MPDVKLSGSHTLHYLDPHPKGRQGIILLHGLGATAESWGLQFPALVRAGYRPIAPDLPGFGRSRYTGRISADVMEQSVLELMEQIRLPSAPVAGISMGGAVALRLAAGHPECIQKLVLVNTFARLRWASSPRRLVYFARRALLLYTFGLKRQAGAVADNLFPLPEQAPLRKILIQQILESDPRSYRSAMRSLARFNLESELAGIRVPTLIVTGEKDRTVPPEVQARLLAIPSARQVVIPNAGHAVIADSPEAFNHHLLGFLQEGSPKAAGPDLIVPDSPSIV